MSQVNDCPDESPQQAWLGEREAPLTLSLTDYVRGREIIHAESEVDSHWHGLIRLRFRGSRSPQLLIQPIQPEAGSANPNKLDWALQFSGGRTPAIWTPKRSFLGDGPLSVRDLQLLVGRTCAGMRTGAASGPLSVACLDFDDGFSALLVPQPLPFALSLQIQCVVLVRIYFLEQIRRDAKSPSTPGDDLLE